jgi:hypothetical protein
MQTIAASLVPVISEPVLINRPTTTVTARGHAALAVVRLEQTIRDLDGSDRDYIIGILRDLIEDATA